MTRHDPIDPCECGHPITDHLATPASPCDIDGCSCDQFVPAYDFYAEPDEHR